MELKLYHFMPDKLNLYGDVGNVISLKKRCEWRGIDLKIENITSTTGIKLSDCDMFFIGGGSDREQCIATEQFSKIKNEFKAAIENGTPALTICGGYQFLGEYYKTVHGGRTYHDYETLGDVIVGFGNNDDDKKEGLLYNNLIGTYLHGPILPKNPRVTDYLIKAALDNKYSSYDFPKLDDSVEYNANKFMAELLKKGI